MLTRRAAAQVLVVVTAGLIGVVAATALAATTESHRLRIEVRVLGDRFEQGEPVPFEVLACSDSYAPMWRTVPSDDAMWVIYGPQAGPVADSSHYRRSQRTERVMWWPRSCRRVATDVWDQTQWNVGRTGSTGQIVRGSSTPPGHYAIQGMWAGQVNEDLEAGFFSIDP